MESTKVPINSVLQDNDVLVGGVCEENLDHKFCVCPHGLGPPLSVRENGCVCVPPEAIFWSVAAIPSAKNKINEKRNFITPRG
jgi:hypothetical protein